MPTLLVVHHTPSPSVEAMLESALAGAVVVLGASGKSHLDACWELGATLAAGLT